MTALGNLPEEPRDDRAAIDVRLELRPPLLQLGELQKALALSQQAENMAKLIGDERRLARVYTYLVNYHYLKGEPDAAIAYGERCLAIGEAAQDVALQALARGYMGYSYHAQGRYREAETVLLQNVERLEEVRAKDGGAQTTVSYASSTGWLAFALAELGEFDLAASYASHGPARGREPSAMPMRRPSPGRWAGWWRCAAATWRRRSICSSGAWRRAATSSSPCGGPSRPRCSASPARAWAGPRTACRCWKTACASPRSWA